MLKLARGLVIPFLLVAPLAFAEEYTLGPDSQRQPGVPQGKVTKYEWASKIYPGTVRDYWVYVPAQYKPEKPACTMVFQDGFTFVNENGAFKTTIVFDNLIHKGDMPVTIGVFINPGVVPGGANRQSRFNRSAEYDAVGPRFPTFLIEEVLAEVAKHYNLSNDPNDRAISGSSSGGNASFNAAWTRPDVFHRVLSFIGGFTNLRGDHIYPSLVRKMETKPLRVFLQDGLQDINVYSNYELGAALRDANYDHKLVIGTEAHNSKHGSAILPEALRWLWRDYPKPIAKPAAGPRHYLSNNIVLDSDTGWEVVGQGYQRTDGPAVDAAGSVFFSDAPNNRIYKISGDGKVAVFRENTGEASGLMFGPDGRLYACQNSRKRIVAFAAGGKESVIAEGVRSHDLAVSPRGEIYFTDPESKRVWLIDAKGHKRVVHEGILFPTGVRFSPDHAFLMVADRLSRWVWSFSVQPDGSLANGVPFHRLEIPDEVESGALRSGADGMTVDADGFVYVATKLGIQIADPAGRTVGILNKPETGDPSSVVFGGPGLQALYATSGGKVFRRTIKKKGTFPWVEVVPPRPRL
ncbi:MAG TPA: SMP-30/gluconolactonase/LRE family protein [Bryobacteraceae bacterium]|nr:SMP-30/gluconolactonase/LRE family protein [Bryobacteraceae bacterium]